MAVREILTVDHPVLRKKCAKIQRMDGSLQKLVDDMIETMHDANGVGLAAPQVGVPEDPATGSAHCCLGPYWSGKLGRMELKGYQASSRGAVIGARWEGGRVYLTGKAVTVFRADWYAE